MVTRGVRDDAARTLVLCELGDRVPGTAELEGTDTLKILAFEKRLPINVFVQGCIAQHRCSPGVPLKPSGSGGNITKIGKIGQRRKSDPVGGGQV